MSTKLSDPDKGSAKSDQGRTKKVNIVLPLSTLFKADRKVLKLKEQGETTDRSRYIANLIEKDVSEDEG